MRACSVVTKYDGGAHGSPYNELVPGSYIPGCVARARMWCCSLQGAGRRQWKGERTLGRIKLNLRRIRQGIRAIILFKNWPTVLSMYTRGGKGYETLELRNGRKFKVRRWAREMQTILEVYRGRVYHKYLDRLKQGSVVIDIGANIGAFSILAATYCPGVRVYSYEPFRESWELLKDNVALNGLEESIKPLNLGVAGSTGPRVLSLNETSTGGHSLFGSGKRKVDIDVVSLEDVFRENGLHSCDVAKIDCEGAEFEIIYSAPRGILQMFQTIALEVHASRAVNKIVELKNYLEDAGFEVDISKVLAGYGYMYAERKVGTTGLP